MSKDKRDRTWSRLDWFFPLYADIARARKLKKRGKIPESQPVLKEKSRTGFSTTTACITDEVTSNLIGRGVFAHSYASASYGDKIYELPADIEYEEMPAKEYFDTMDSDVTRLFKEKLCEQIARLNPNINCSDDSEVVRFLTAQFKKHQMDGISSTTLKNWLTKASPDSTGRANVFKLCFALEMNAVQTAEFFLKGYLSKPFNYKNTREAAYWYCLQNGKSYNDAQQIIETVENGYYTNKSVQPERYSCDVAKDLSHMHEDDELIIYLMQHRYTEDEQNFTITEKIGELRQECYGLAEKEVLLSRNETRKVKSPEALLDIIYGYDAAEMDATIQKSKFPKVIKNNWPNRQLFHKIEKHNVQNYDNYRKVLILLVFYSYYAHAYLQQRQKRSNDEIDLQRYADEFECELNQILAECGYVQIYKRNPFDWMMLYCANARNPLNKFRDLIANYYLDVIDNE